MKLIALDSSGLVASAAVLADGQLLAEYTVNYKKTHSQTLLPMLDELANMIELDAKSVDAIAVAAGPGSFTGLRIGSATAKGLGLALQKPIVEVPTLAGLAFNLFGAKGLICPIMDARRQQVYSGIYRFEAGELITVRDQAPVAVEDLLAEIAALPAEETAEGVIFLGDGVEAYKDIIEEGWQAEKLAGIPLLFAPPHVSRQRAASVGALGERLYAQGLAVPAAEHVPIYLRKSQAEQEAEKKAAKKEGSA